MRSKYQDFGGKPVGTQVGLGPTSFAAFGAVSGATQKLLFLGQVYFFCSIMSCMWKKKTENAVVTRLMPKKKVRDLRFFFSTFICKKVHATCSQKIKINKPTFWMPMWPLGFLPVAQILRQHWDI